MTELIDGLGRIVERYDAILIDQYGVLHDGRAAFAGAVECLRQVARAGLPMVVLTNSGKTGRANIDRLDQIGFPRHLFKAVVTSGDLSRKVMIDWVTKGRLKPGAQVEVLSRGGDGGILAGLGLRAAEMPESAQMLLISGVEPETMSREAYARWLAPLARRGAPAICANPDRLMYTSEGPAFGPGVVAEDYAEASGAEVLLLGKPEPAIFAAGLQALGDPDPARVLMIGDSPEHDIAGAAAAGCATLLISGGVQAGTGGGVPADFSMERLVW